MCGIIGGFWSEWNSHQKIMLNEALSLIKHRGPNDQGCKITGTSNGVVALGHTRLSIIDLSVAGHQPMLSSDGRYTIVFNGEIYNYKELRKELITLGCIFTSDTDTEVLLQAWITWGKDCLLRLLGMFAFVVHDQVKHTLTCVRDAFGIKPFFYFRDEKRFIFASEQQSLLKMLAETPQVDWQRSYDYLVHGDYDSQEQTFIEGVKHLLPAHYMVFDTAQTELSVPMPWWKPTIKPHSKFSFEEAVQAVRKQFLENVRLHLRSDVPLGVALSGGIDSSSLVCAMRYLNPDSTIHTFSFIPTAGSDLSEESWIDRINSFTRATPHKIAEKRKGLVTDLDDMIRVHGEPFGSTSIYAQYIVFRLAKQTGITVTLDGQGGDELLAGYHGYPGERLLSLLENKQFFDMLHFAKNWSRWPGRTYRHAWMYLGKILFPDGIYKSARKMLGRDFSPPWLKVDLLREHGVLLNETRIPLQKDARGLRVIERLCNSLQHRGLPSLLRHADRNSMCFSIESRVPFLTIPMVELLYSLPEKYLIADSGETKKVFREAMRGIVPDDVLDRKDKLGFATPEQKWIIDSAPIFREWLHMSNKVPFIDQNALLESFDSVVAGQTPYTKNIWRWINFVRWYCMFLSEKRN